MGVCYIEPVADEQACYSSAKLRVREGRCMGPVRHLVDVRDTLSRRTETVNRHRPIHGRSGIAACSDGGQLNLVTAASERMSQISDVALLSTATRRVELRKHQDLHGARTYRNFFGAACPMVSTRSLGRPTHLRRSSEQVHAAVAGQL